MVKMTPSNLDVEQVDDEEYLPSSDKTKKTTDDNKSTHLIKSKEAGDEENSNKSKSLLVLGQTSLVNWYFHI